MHGLKVDYRTDPSRYRHWKLTFDGPVATLAMDVAEDAGIRDGYKLKLNSYDLGVDIELARRAAAHPLRAPRSPRGDRHERASDRIFCSGANIFMLGLSSHAWKVNFCKFTNETRNGIEDASRHSGLKFLAAVNGTCAGGGYELALACDEIWLVDDRSSSVSLPEVPLLGVLPGTGGLTRLTDKRQRAPRPGRRLLHGDRRRARPAREGLAARRRDREAGRVRGSGARAARSALADASDRPRDARGVALTPLARSDDDDGLSLRLRRRRDRPRRAHRDVHRARARRRRSPPTSPASRRRASRGGRCSWRASSTTRSSRCAPTSSRSARGSSRRAGDADAVLAVDAALAAHADHWLVRETVGMLRRTFARLDVSSRTLFALIEPGSCFAGTLLELALAADRTYMLRLPDDAEREPRIAVSPQNFGAYPMVNGADARSRAASTTTPRDCRGRAHAGRRRSTPTTRWRSASSRAHPTTSTGTTRSASRSRSARACRPTRSPGSRRTCASAAAETMETRIFGRLSAWQNWIFNRPNAVGEKGALKVYGKGDKAQFDFERV